jgi:hypothetical protein
VNPFLQLAERQTANPVKAQLRAAKARRSKREQQRDKERRELSAYYRAMRKQELVDALAGPEGETLRSYLARLDQITLDSIPILTVFVRSGGLRSVSANTLFLTLRMTSERIISLREKDGLAPFDDPLPGDPATPEQDLRAAFADQANMKDQTYGR